MATHFVWVEVFVLKTRQDMVHPYIDYCQQSLEPHWSQITYVETQSNCFAQFLCNFFLLFSNFVVSFFNKNDFFVTLHGGISNIVAIIDFNYKDHMDPGLLYMFHFTLLTFFEVLCFTTSLRVLVMLCITTSLWVLVIHLISYHETKNDKIESRRNKHI